MASSFGTEEFAVDASKVPLLDQYVQKVQRLFGVKVTFENISVVGENKTQWLVVSGVQHNRLKAAKFVQSMCNPKQVSSYKALGKRLLDDAVLEEVERESNAFIQRTGSLTLQVMGDDLECALAVSQLEQSYSLELTDFQAGEHRSSADDGSSGSPDSQTAVNLHRQVSTNSVVSGVKGLMVDRTGHTQFQDKVYDDETSPGLKQSRPQGKPSPSSSSHVPSHEDLSERPRDIVGRTEAVGGGGGEEGQREAPQETEGEEEEQKEILRKQGRIMGYKEQEIEETLLFFDFSVDKVQIPHFLNALDQVRANRLNEESAARKPASQPSPFSPVDSKGKGKHKPGKQPGTSAQAKTHKGASKPSTGAGAPVSRVTPMRKASQPSSTASGSVAALEEINDSIIFMGEEGNNDDSICVVDPSTLPVSSSSSMKRAFPSSPPSQYSSAVRKRKDYSNDDDQTYVLKPFRTDTSGAGSSAGSKMVWRPEQAQAAEGASHAAAAAAVAGPGADMAASSRDSRNSSRNRSRDSSRESSTDLRFIVIDGSNVAMSHGNDKEFSCRGIQICVNYFVERGHKVKAWVPRTKTYQNRGGRHPPVRNQEILEQLKEQGILGYTPARTLNTKHVVSHDDPFILELAQKEDAVVVSNDNFKEFVGEFRFIIENRVLSYVFSDDHFMLPRDPLGKFGPPLDQFLRKSGPRGAAADRSRFPDPKPMGPGQRAQFPHHQHHQQQRQQQQQQQQQHRHQPQHHQHRSHQNQQHHHQPPGQPLQPLFQQPGDARYSSRGPEVRGGAAFPTPLTAPLGRMVYADSADDPPQPHKEDGDRKRERDSPPPERHQEVTDQLLEALKLVFPNSQQEPQLRQVLANHAYETDLNKLTNYCIAALNL